jgi:hypothetical protein
MIIYGGVLVFTSWAGSGAARPLPVATAPHSAPPSDTIDEARHSLPTVSLDTPGFASWALLNRRTGRITGSANLDAPSDTMSMIKAWLAADYLRQLTGAPDQRTLNLITIMIRDSNNKAAEEIYRRNGQRAGIERMVAICKLTDSQPYRRPMWSNTVVSARDVARLGVCIADGRAAGPTWTEFLLNEMRSVRGSGNFGPRTVFPPKVAAQIAIKNGYLLRAEDKLWHISCLAVSANWSMGVLLRYPGRLGFDHGRTTCRSVAQQLLPAL